MKTKVVKLVNDDSIECITKKNLLKIIEIYQHYLNLTIPLSVDFVKNNDDDEISHMVNFYFNDDVTIFFQEDKMLNDNEDDLLVNLGAWLINNTPSENWTSEMIEIASVFESYCSKWKLKKLSDFVKVDDEKSMISFFDFNEDVSEE